METDPYSWGAATVRDFTGSTISTQIPTSAHRTHTSNKSMALGYSGNHNPLLLTSR